VLLKLMFLEVVYEDVNEVKWVQGRAWFFNKVMKFPFPHKCEEFLDPSNNYEYYLKTLRALVWK